MNLYRNVVFSNTEIDVQIVMQAHQADLQEGSENLDGANGDNLRRAGSRCTPSQPVRTGYIRHHN